MKLNNLNNKIQFGAYAQEAKGKAQDMSGLGQYDEYTQNMLATIKEIKSAKEAEKTLLQQAQNPNELEQLAPVLYKHKDAHITIMFEYFGKPFVENLKILNKLKLECTPQYIETVNKDGTMFIVSKIKNTENGNLEPFILNKEKVSKEEKLKVFHEMQKLTKAGFVDSGVLRPENWYITPENTIMIPDWKGLRKIQPNESQQEIVQKYYDILFK